MNGAGGREGGRAGGWGESVVKFVYVNVIVIKPVHKNDEHTLKGRGW